MTFRDVEECSHDFNMLVGELYTFYFTSFSNIDHSVMLGNLSENIGLTSFGSDV
jgi:hypothetical protein